MLLNPLNLFKPMAHKPKKYGFVMKINCSLRRKLATSWLLLTISLLFSANVHSDQDRTALQTENRYTILVLGDSLSAAYNLRSEQGWVYLLNRKWDESKIPATLINAAISGDTTDGGLARLPRLLSLHNPSHLYIELGGNNGLQGHNPKKIQQNIEQMIKLAKNKSVHVILQEMQIPTNYGARYTRAFNQIFHDLSVQFDIPLIPFFLQEIALKPELMMNDGIHPTSEAQPLIADFMSQQFIEALNLTSSQITEITREQYSQ